MGSMKRAIEEAEYMDQYDYLVVNDESGCVRGRDASSDSGRT